MPIFMLNACLTQPISFRNSSRGVAGRGSESVPETCAALVRETCAPLCRVHSSPRHQPASRGSSAGALPTPQPAVAPCAVARKPSPSGNCAGSDGWLRGGGLGYRGGMPGGMSTQLTQSFLFFQARCHLRNPLTMNNYSRVRF